MSEAERELMRVLEYKIIGHVSWLHNYADGSTKENWRDMRLLAIRQTDGLMFDVKEYFTLTQAATK